MPPNPIPFVGEGIGLIIPSPSGEKVPVRADEGNIPLL